MSVAIASAMWRLQRQGDRLRREEAISVQLVGEDLELQRIGADHDDDGHEENNHDGDNHQGDND